MQWIKRAAPEMHKLVEPIPFSQTSVESLKFSWMSMVKKVKEGM